MRRLQRRHIRAVKPSRWPSIGRVFTMMVGCTSWPRSWARESRLRPKVRRCAWKPACSSRFDQLAGGALRGADEDDVGATRGKA